MGLDYVCKKKNTFIKRKKLIFLDSCYGIGYERNYKFKRNRNMELERFNEKGVRPKSQMKWNGENFGCRGAMKMNEIVCWYKEDLGWGGKWRKCHRVKRWIWVNYVLFRRETQAYSSFVLHPFFS